MRQDQRLAHNPGWWCVEVTGCAGPPLISCWQGWLRSPLLWLTPISPNVLCPMHGGPAHPATATHHQPELWASH